MKQKPVIQIELAMIMDYRPDEGLLFFERAVPAPRGKQLVTVTRLNTRTGKREERKYLARHVVAKKLDGLIGRQRV